jgi:hypothetical protein
MNTSHAAFREQSALIPPQAALEVERDHLWWINDATRMVRTGDWSSLNPEHIRHLLEEVRDLAWLLHRDQVLNPPDPF